MHRFLQVHVLAILFIAPLVCGCEEQHTDPADARPVIFVDIQIGHSTFGRLPAGDWPELVSEMQAVVCSILDGTGYRPTTARITDPDAKLTIIGKSMSRGGTYYHDGIGPGEWFPRAGAKLTGEMKIQVGERRHTASLDIKEGPIERNPSNSSVAEMVLDGGEFPLRVFDFVAEALKLDRFELALAVVRERPYHDGVERCIDGVLRQVGKEAPHRLFDALEDKNSDVRIRCIEGLKSLGKEIPVRTLMAMLEDGESDVRVRCVRLLSDFEDATVVPTLIATLKEDTDFAVRSVCAQCLRKTGDASVVPALIAALKEDSEACVRETCAEALGDCDDESAVPSLISALEDHHYGVKRAALAALRSFDDRSAIPAIMKLIHDERSKSPYAQPVVSEAIDTLWAFGVDWRTEAD